MERDYEQERADAAEKLINDFSNLVNGSVDIKTLLKTFQTQHRTLQQSMFGVLLKIIVMVASDEYSTDGRNEESKKIAKKLIEGYAQISAEQRFKYLTEVSGWSTDNASKEAQATHDYIIKNPGSHLSTPLI